VIDPRDKFDEEALLGPVPRAEYVALGRCDPKIGIDGRSMIDLILVSVGSGEQHHFIADMDDALILARNIHDIHEGGPDE
jgi:hypothetical protein